MFGAHKLDVLFLSALKLFLSILSNVETKQKCFFSLHITRSKVYGGWSEIENSSKRKINFSPNKQPFCLSHVVWNVVFLSWSSFTKKHRGFNSNAFSFVCFCSLLLLLFVFLLFLLTWLKQQIKLGKDAKYRGHFTHNFFCLELRGLRLYKQNWKVPWSNPTAELARLRYPTLSRG